MKKLWILATAIFLEVTASISLRGAVENALWYVLVVGGYIGAFVLMWLLLREGMALGIAYGIWGASGVALTAVLGSVIFQDPMTLPMMCGIIVVILGILTVEIGSQKATDIKRGAK